MVQVHQVGRAGGGPPLARRPWWRLPRTQLLRTICASAILLWVLKLSFGPSPRARPSNRVVFPRVRPPEERRGSSYYAPPPEIVQLDLVSPLPRAVNTTSIPYHTCEQIPDWMKKYLIWHQQRRALLNEHNWNMTTVLVNTTTTGFRFKYLILRCRADLDPHCGGLSDRLKSLPTLLWMAARTQRLFFLHWTHPAPLEEFLQPTLWYNPPSSTVTTTASSRHPLGLDWTLPPFLLPALATSRVYTTMGSLVRAMNHSTQQHQLVWSARVQDQHGGSAWYNQQETTPPRAFRLASRHVFFCLFRPSPRVEAALEQQLALFRPAGPYVAAQVRAYYGRHRRPDRAQVQALARNAVRCARQLVTDSKVPVLLTADSDWARQVAPHQPGVVWSTPTRPTTWNATRPAQSEEEDVEALHLDQRFPDSQRPPSSAYDSIFIDLLLLAEAACISHGPGGYGRFGVLLSRNASCFFKYVDSGRYLECPEKTP